MKSNIVLKSAIALVIASTAATAVAETKLYGRFRAAVVCTDTGADSDDCNLENRSSRWGIKADEDLGNGMTAFGRYEFGVNLDTGTHASTGHNRLSYVGLKGDFGEFSIGTRWSPFYNNVISPTDATQLIGGTWTERVGYFSPFRVEDTLNYKNTVGGLKFGVMTRMTGDGEGDQFDEIHLGGTIDLGAVSVGFGMISEADEDAKAADPGNLPFELGTDAVAAKDGETAIGINVSGKAGDIGLSGSYTSLDEADVSGLLFQATFPLGDMKSVIVHFGNDMNDNGAEPTKISAEYAQQLTKRFRWFAGVESIDVDVSGADDITRYGAGMRLEF